MLEDQRYALEQVLTIAENENTPAIVLAGDLYDKTIPSAEAVSLFDWFLTEATRKNISVLAIPGNHDSAERIAYASSLLAAHGVHFPGVYDGSIPCVQLPDEHGTVAFWLMPFLKPAHIRPYFPDLEIGQSYTTAIQAALSTCDINPQMRNVVLAHQFVTAGSAMPETSDSELNLGGLDNVDISVFDQFDYVALGHVHRPQRIGRDEARYAGSLLKYSFSEIPHPKSACLVDLGPKSTIEVKLIPIEPLHDMREIRGPLESILADDVVQQGNANDYVHVVLTDEEPTIDALTRVRSVYPNVMAVDYDNIRSRHTSTAALDSEALHKLNPYQLFATFYEEQNGKPLDEEQAKIVAETLDKSGYAQEGGAR